MLCATITVHHGPHFRPRRIFSRHYNIRTSYIILYNALFGGLLSSIHFSLRNVIKIVIIIRVVYIIIILTTSHALVITNYIIIYSVIIADVSTVIFIMYKYNIIIRHAKRHAETRRPVRFRNTMRENIIIIIYDHTTHRSATQWRT